MGLEFVCIIYLTYLFFLFIVSTGKILGALNSNFVILIWFKVFVRIFEFIFVC